MHVRAPKGSGGVGILVNVKLLNMFKPNIIDKSYEGIWAVSQSGYQSDFLDIKLVWSSKIVILLSLMHVDFMYWAWSTCRKNVFHERVTIFYTHLFNDHFLTVCLFHFSKCLINLITTNFWDRELGQLIHILSLQEPCCLIMANILVRKWTVMFHITHFDMPICPSNNVFSANVVNKIANMN